MLPAGGAGCRELAWARAAARPYLPWQSLQLQPPWRRSSRAQLGLPCTGLPRLQQHRPSRGRPLPCQGVSTLHNQPAPDQQLSGPGVRTCLPGRCPVTGVGPLHGCFQSSTMIPTSASQMSQARALLLRFAAGTDPKWQSDPRGCFAHWCLLKQASVWNPGSPVHCNLPPKVCAKASPPRALAHLTECNAGTPRRRGPLPAASRRLPPLPSLCALGSAQDQASWSQWGALPPALPRGSLCVPARSSQSEMAAAVSRWAWFVGCIAYKPPSCVWFRLVGRFAHLVLSGAGKGETPPSPPSC